MIAITALANVGVGAVYAGLGAAADTGPDFWLESLASICLPSAGLIAAKAWKSRIPSQ